MAIVPLTLAVSLCLVGTFVIFFLCVHARGRLTSSEHDSLLPLAEESPRVASAPAAKSRCGCHDGARPPCAGCLKKSA